MYIVHAFVDHLLALETLAVDGEPGAALVDDLQLDGQVDDLADLGDALARCPVFRYRNSRCSGKVLLCLA